MVDADVIVHNWFLCQLSIDNNRTITVAIAPAVKGSVFMRRFRYFIVTSSPGLYKDRNTNKITIVKQRMASVSTWMRDRLSVDAGTVDLETVNWSSGGIMKRDINMRKLSSSSLCRIDSD